MRFRSIAALCLALAGCGADAPVTTPLVGAASPPARSEHAAESTSPSATSPGAPEEGVAPPELAGTWRRSFEGETLLLTLDETGYLVRFAGGSGAGRIFVDGDRITFSNSNRCDGTGSYTWSIEEGRLRFRLVGEDPCGRVDFLLRATFGRVDP